MHRAQVPPPATPQPIRSQNAGLGTVLSVEPVYINKGFQVWRDGQTLTVNDGLVIRLSGIDGAEFMPRALTPPMFVLGDTVGRALISPLEGPQTVLLMAAPPPDTEVPLWMTTPGQTRLSLRGATLQAARSRALAASASNGINIRTPPEGTPQTHHTSVDALASAVLERQAAPELCAQVGKQCGTPMTQYGMIDCGECPEGQLCTPSNQCCTPQADAQSCP